MQGSGLVVPCGTFWYQTFEAAGCDAGVSGNGLAKTFGRVEFKAYCAHHRRLMPGCFEQPRVTEWMRQIGANKSQVDWLTDQVDAALACIQNFFATEQPEISSGVALFLKHSSFPPEVTRNIAAFAADDEARIWMHFG